MRGRGVEVSKTLFYAFKEISKIIAVKDNGKIISPCGICQECMRQLGDYSKNIQVMMSNQEIKTLGELTDEWWGNQDNE